MGRGRAALLAKHPWEQLKTQGLLLAQAVGLFVRLMQGVPEAHLRREYRRRALAAPEGPAEPGGLLLYYVSRSPCTTTPTPWPGR